MTNTKLVCISKNHSSIVIATITKQATSLLRGYETGSPGSFEIKKGTLSDGSYEAVRRRDDYGGMITEACSLKIFF